MVKVSVLITCKKEEDANKMKDILSHQTFKDFELVITNGSSITEGWNHAIEQAKGEILVIAETDCTPINTWLEELVAEVEDNKLVAGLEVINAPLSSANIAIKRDTLGSFRFDHGFYPAIDTELFERLLNSGIQIKKINKAMVIHNRQSTIKRRLQWAFLYGKSWARIYYNYNVPYLKPSRMLGASLLRQLEAFLSFIGTLYGIIRFHSEKRKFSQRKTEN